jgi:proton-translocating NADH-quinone oxidoreductase chain M
MLFCLINFFLAADLMLLYIYFESVLVPLYIIIVLYGSRSRRIHAAYQFFFYTLIGSFFMLLGIMYIYTQTHTTLLAELPGYDFSFTEEKILWAMFAFALAIKIPLVPLHIWLPEAHVEAPTIGSVILAAVVLKMGGYGIIRILLPIFPAASIYYQNFVFTICIVGMLYAAFTALRQNDIKRIIAYSSVVHMSYTTLGLFSFNVLSISSSIFGMIAHGFIAGGLFFTLGMLYDRYQTRNLSNYASLYHFSKSLSFSFFFLLLANVAFPGTANFPSELGIFIGLFDTNPLVPLLLMPGLILNGAYNIWLGTRLIFGPFSPNSTVYKNANLLNDKEKIVLYSIWGAVLLMGFFPFIITFSLELPVRILVALIV